MLTQKLIQEKCSDLEKDYVAFMVEQFFEWENFVKATQKLLDNKEANETEVPKPYLLEFRMLREVLKMEATGKFDWNNPVLKESFAHFAASPYYKLWGSTIVKISLRLAEIAGVKTLLEIGAGRGNLTEIMLKEMSISAKPIKLIVTDAAAIVIDSIGKLKNSYPYVDMETLLWDIKESPTKELLDKIEPPCLVYERASIMYSNIPAIKHLTRIADIGIFGDMFNYTGQLYAVDKIAKKIGGEPLFYNQIKPIMDTCYQDHFMFDLRAQQELKYPNTTILIGWK